jgi:hypothetical protein
VFEVEREPRGRPEPLPTLRKIHQRTEDLFTYRWVVAKLQRRYGLTPETLRDFEIGLEVDRKDPPWISIPIRDANGTLVNVRRRYFGPKPELHATGRKYRNLTGRRDARLYPAHRLPAEGSRLVVCCGEFDALAARQAGIAAVSSTGGANTWPGGWDDLATRFDVTVTFDRGEEALAEHIADRLGARVMHLPADLPRGTDLAQLYVERGPAGLRAAVRRGRVVRRRGAVTRTTVPPR